MPGPYRLVFLGVEGEVVPVEEQESLDDLVDKKAMTAEKSERRDSDDA
jgi:hypothetical protein